jgi:cell wall-associated NlpC family hydrolase
VAIYLGGGRYIEAPHPGADVRISVLSTGYYPDFFGRVS